MEASVIYIYPTGNNKIIINILLVRHTAVKLEFWTSQEIHPIFGGRLTC